MKLSSLLSALLISLTVVHGSAIAAQPIRVVVSMSEQYNPVTLMPEYCKKFDLDVTVAQKPPVAYDASAGGMLLLERGEADVVSAPASSALIARSNGLDVYAITNIAVGGSNLIVAPSIKSYKDLKGKTIGQLRGSSTTIHIERKLKEVGLTLADVKLQYMAIDQMALALSRGLVDAYAGSYPHTVRSVAANEGIILDEFPANGRQLFANAKLPAQAASTFKTCVRSLSTLINDSSKKSEVTRLVDNAKNRGTNSALPPNIKLAYRVEPSFNDADFIEITDWLKAEKKIKETFVYPTDFNRTK